MTQDDITRRAREAGFDGFDSLSERLHKFADLVAAHEREALEGWVPHYLKDRGYEPITTLRTAIEQAEKHEPVAWQIHPFDYGIGHEGVYARTDRPEQVEMWKRKGWTVQPLYTTPPALNPLPEQAIVDLLPASIPAQYDGALIDFARVIEATLKEKKT